MTAVTLPSNIELYKYHDTESNRANLHSKLIGIRALQVMARHDLDRLPVQGQRLVRRLDELRAKKKSKKEKRDKELTRIWFWETAAKILKLVGALLATGVAWWASLLPNYNFITSQFIPGALLVANGVYESQIADKRRHLTEAEYYDQVYGLNNECVVVLAELAPMLQELD